MWFNIRQQLRCGDSVDEALQYSQVLAQLNEIRFRADTKSLAIVSGTLFVYDYVIGYGPIASWSWVFNVNRKLSHVTRYSEH